MRLLFELIRILAIFGILGGLGWMLLINIYPEQNQSWFGAIGIFLLLFVLYRNKLQFTGWSKIDDKQKLSKFATTIIISLGILFIILPFILGSLFN